MEIKVRSIRYIALALLVSAPVAVQAQDASLSLPTPAASFSLAARSTAALPAPAPALAPTHTALTFTRPAFAIRRSDELPRSGSSTLRAAVMSAVQQNLDFQMQTLQVSRSGSRRDNQTSGVRNHGLGVSSAGYEFPLGN